MIAVVYYINYMKPTEYIYSLQEMLRKITASTFSITTGIRILYKMKIIPERLWSVL